MISKKVVGTVVFIFLQLNIMFAQSSLEMSSVYALTSEKIVSNEDNDHYSSQLFHSFGINGKKIFPSNFFVQGGLHLHNFGTKVVGEEGVIIDDMPERIIGKSIDIPINVGYYFLNCDRVRLGISLGVNNGILLHQYHDYYGYMIEVFPVYNDYILQLNASAEIGIKLTNHIILNIRPVFLRQINSNYDDYKQRGIGGQFGISYGFKGK